MNRLVAILAVLLGGCSAAQIADTQSKIMAIEVQIRADADTFCEVAGVVVPFVQAGAILLGMAVPSVNALVALDQTMVHPAVLAACKAVGGLPVAAPKG